jgi:hypothetical protein
MKKYFLILTLIVYLPATSTAQFGIKAGVNFSYISGNEDMVSNKSSKVGFQGGLMFKIALKDDWLSVQPELIYIRKGGIFYMDQLKFDVRVDYVELPVLGVINFLGGNLNIYLGPQFSLLTKVEYVIFEENGAGSDFKDTDLSHYETFDIGLAAGIGVELETVIIELRSSIGFLAVEKDLNYNGQQYYPSSKNFNVQFLVGYFF